MATEYERIDALFKAVAGLLTPHLDTCESSITDYDDGDISDILTNIEDNQMNIEDISDRMDSVEDGIITTDTIDDHVLTGDALIDEIDDRIRYQLDDSINEKINDYFQYEGGGDLIAENLPHSEIKQIAMEACDEAVLDMEGIADIVREEVQAQLSPERLVASFIEGLAEALNAPKYTVTIRDGVA
tara:strand:+ start:102 stop:659 length:558 start_codon:yes stop_codon:yes gene_type:complete